MALPVPRSSQPADLQPAFIYMVIFADILENHVGVDGARVSARQYATASQWAVPSRQVSICRFAILEYLKYTTVGAKTSAGDCKHV